MAPAWDDWLLQFLAPHCLWSRPPVWRYGLAVVIVVAATALRWVLTFWMGTTVPYNIALVAVVGTTVLLGIGPGLLTVLLGDIAVEVFVLGSLPTTFDGKTLLRLGTSVVIGFFVCAIFHAIRVAQVKARQSEERYRALLDLCPDAILVHTGGKFVFANPAAALVFGASSPKDLIGKDVLERTHPEDRPMAGQRIAQAYGGVATPLREMRFLRLDGSTVDIEVMGAKVEFDGTPAIQVVVRDISERKRAKEEIGRLNQDLQRRVAELQTIFETAPIGLAIAEDVEGHHIYGNPANERLLGVKTGGELSKGGPRPAGYRCLQEGRELAVTKLPMQRAIRGETVTGQVFDVVREDGHSLTLYSCAAPLFDERGQPRGAVGAFMDITERKWAEEALRESEAKYRNLFLNMTEEVHFWKLVRDEEDRIQTWRLVDANPPTLKTWGKTLDEIRGKTTDEIFGPGSTEHYLPVVQKIMTEGVPYVFEDFFPNLDRYFRFTSVPLGDYFITTGADITSIKKAEETLRESEERFRAIYEQAAVGIEMLDFEGRLLQGNDKLSKILGYSHEELQQRTFADITHPEDLACELPLLQRLLAGEIANYTLEKRYLPKEGPPVWVRVTSSLARTSQPYRFSLIEDITDRHRADEALQRTAADLARSNQDLEQFAYVASHDLQEPLRMVTGFVQLLQQTYGSRLDAQADQYIEYAVDGARRMQTLIDDLLAYSRVGTRGRQFVPTDVGAALQLALVNLRASIQETAAEITHGELPTLRGDSTQLVQLFQNLVGNALKFRGTAPPRIHVDACRQGDYWQFSVRDNGIGIAPEYQERIFLIFQRLHTRKQYPGTGIGLAICKKIAERHGGQIWVESQPGQGTVFSFTLPA